MKVLIKAMQPHRQKVLTADGEELRLQRWANKKAANELRGAGGDAAGEQFNQARDKLMRDAVANPDEHGLKFLNERLPFEGQNLESSLSDPMDSPEFKEDMTEDESFSLAEKLDEKDIADITDASSAETERAMGEKDPSSEEMSDELKRRQSELFDESGKLRDGMPPEEEEFNPDAEAEHMKRIMTSRQVPMRDAWSILKNEAFGGDDRFKNEGPYATCPKCGNKDNTQDHRNKVRSGTCENCLQAGTQFSMSGHGPTHDEDGSPY